MRAFYVSDLEPLIERTRERQRDKKRGKASYYKRSKRELYTKTNIVRTIGKRPIMFVLEKGNTVFIRK